MKKRKFGDTGLTVGEVGMGCWELSGVSRGGGMGYGPQDDADSVGVIKRALELGIDFFDTADAYGLGHSEVVLGRTLKSTEQTPFVATKVGNNFYVQPWGKSFERGYIENAVENSLQRLGLDRVGLYQLHNPPLDVIKSGDVFETLENLKRQGKIRYYGVSLNTPEEGAAAIATAPSLAAIMCPYNILEQENGVFFSEAQERGVAIIARSPLASGRLTGAFTEQTEFAEGDYRATLGKAWLVDSVAKVGQLRFLLNDSTPTLAQAALKFILANRAVTLVVPGPKTKSELEDNVRASTSAPMAAQDLNRLKQLAQEGLLSAPPSRAPLKR